MSQFDEVVVEGGGTAAPTASGGGNAIVEVAKADGSVAKPRGGSRASDKASGGQFSSVADAMPPDARTGRVFSDSTREKMAAIVAAHRAEMRGDDADDPDDPGDEPAKAVSGGEGTDAGAQLAEESDLDDPDDPEAATKPAAAPEKKQTAAEKDERDEIIARQRTANERLLAELEAARKGTDDAIVARTKRLEDAEEGYLRDPIAAVRSFVASAMGLEPDSPEVERELRDFHVDLTSTVAGVTLDPVHQATRESARTRKEWDREKKRREAGEKKQADSAERAQRDQQVEYATSLIRKGLEPQAEKYPSLHLATVLGQNPEKLVYELLDKGIKAGDFDPKWSDDKLLDAAATLAENHYRPIAERVRASLKPTSTATADAGKTPAVAASDKPSTRQSTGARVTNADASVAPATPPAPKPSTQRKPPPISDDEARKRYALRHLRARK
jgi:hypothetical protein